MKLSIIIPARNEAVYIGKCLESIIAEAKRERADVEIIVGNGKSTDATKEIALRYPGVIVVDSPKNGANAARQAGFEASSGDLIGNIDADTLLPPGWLRRVFKEFNAHPNLVALSGPYIYYDLPFFLRLFMRVLWYLIAPFYFLNNTLLQRNSSVMGGNLVIRRDALEKIGGYNTDIVFYGDDTDTATRLSKVGLVKFSYTFPVSSSGRRFARDGFLATLGKYVLNYVWVALFKKPFTKAEGTPKSRKTQ